MTTNLAQQFDELCRRFDAAKEALVQDGAPRREALLAASEQIDHVLWMLRHNHG
jgi:uncharacterized protein YqgV (UPF0045/DUF77 family)